MWTGNYARSSMFLNTKAPRKTSEYMKATFAKGTHSVQSDIIIASRMEPKKMSKVMELIKA